MMKLTLISNVILKLSICHSILVAPAKTTKNTQSLHSLQKISETTNNKAHLYLFSFFDFVVVYYFEIFVSSIFRRVS
jgi:hypothetical protein